MVIVPPLVPPGTETEVVMAREQVDLVLHQRDQRPASNDSTTCCWPGRNFR
jgi:hypothetical protein